MTPDRFRRFYSSARAAYLESRSSDFTTRRLGHHRLGQALDLLIMETDAEQAGMVDWAMDNGYPEFETVERYGVTPP